RELLTLGFGHRLSIMAQKLADAAGAHVSAEYEGTSLDAIKQMSAMGAGVAILPSLYALVEARRDPTLNIRRIDHKQFRLDISLLWRDGSPMSSHIEEIGRILKSTAEILTTTKAPLLKSAWRSRRRPR